MPCTCKWIGRFIIDIDKGCPDLEGHLQAYHRGKVTVTDEMVERAGVAWADACGTLEEANWRLAMRAALAAALIDVDPAAPTCKCPVCS